MRNSSFAATFSLFSRTFAPDRQDMSTGISSQGVHCPTVQADLFISMVGNHLSELDGHPVPLEQLMKAYIFRGQEDHCTKELGPSVYEPTSEQEDTIKTLMTEFSKRVPSAFASEEANRAYMAGLYKLNDAERGLTDDGDYSVNIDLRLPASYYSDFFDKLEEKEKTDAGTSTASTPESKEISDRSFPTLFCPIQRATCPLPTLGQIPSSSTTLSGDTEEDVWDDSTLD